MLVAQLPGGARTWQATGGEKAWSEEVATMMVLDLRLRQLFWAKTEDGQNGKNAPEMVQPPPVEGEVMKQGSELDVKAASFQRMEERRAKAREARQAAQHNEG